ncbi:GNAT family N-acetyltransferase [Pontimicrobium aquaticum]|uniref:GNAT family N-acetyltransferase n=1 Tax=Pontimicrobium aquaticum TaxID=2565367 RepID=A0A4U0EYX5_9FLAO|nr:GNAT family N-acetyltransferase [Pontimicrobium aquaticum]TJY37247.1 GNAT family N-acetyltransferase [Pontimicrobium aquaticum]
MHKIREAKPEEYSQLGKLMVLVYSQLKGFPKQDEIPSYYHVLKNVGEFTKQPKVKLFVAISKQGKVDGGLVYFGDISYYGAGGKATANQKAAAFRLLAINPETRGKGLGKLLINTCINQAKKEGHKHLVIHSTKSMMLAWKMYERMGFSRFSEIDFEQDNVSVYGSRFEI